MARTVERRWFNQSQPQTLQLATMLLYVNAVLSLLQGLFLGGLGLILLVFIVGQVFGGLGVANERRKGYWLAVVCAVLPVALTAYLTARYHVAPSILTLIFQVALVVALFHRTSRSYIKIWFR